MFKCNFYLEGEEQPIIAEVINLPEKNDLIELIKNKKNRIYKVSSTILQLRVNNDGLTYVEYGVSCF